MVVLSVSDYQKIVRAIRAFDGLWIECDKYMREWFPDVDKITLSRLVLILYEVRLYCVQYKGSVDGLVGIRIEIKHIELFKGFTFILNLKTFYPPA